jgi:hypothetical protein
MRHKTIWSLASTDNPYVRIVRTSTGEIWSKATNALGMSTSWANSAIPLHWDGTAKAWIITLPASLPIGVFDVPLYNAASPADTDAAVTVYYANWNGAGLSAEM